MARKAKYVLPDGLKHCPKCNEIKSIAEFSGGYCKTCAQKYQLKYRHAETWAELRQLLTEAVEKYGPCACGEADVTVLEVTPALRSQFMTLERLKKQAFPPGNRMVCLNCAMRERRKEVEG